jgi:hypothetical protein
LKNGNATATVDLEEEDENKGALRSAKGNKASKSNLKRDAIALAWSETFKGRWPRRRRPLARERRRDTGREKRCAIIKQRDA